MRDYINEHIEEFLLIIFFLISFILGYLCGYIKHEEISKKTDYETNNNCINLENKYYCEVKEDEK